MALFNLDAEHDGPLAWLPYSQLRLLLKPVIIRSYYTCNHTVVCQFEY